jgi:hypothetical protein
MDWHKRLPWRSLALCLVVALYGLCTSGASVRGETRKLWVAVMEDSPHAVVLEEPDRWADAVTVLKFNEQVEILRTLSERENDPLPYFKIEVRGFKGYVIQNALSEESQYQDSDADAEASVAVGASAANNASKGLNRSNERTLSSTDPKFKARIEEVDKTEKTINKLIYGGTDPDPTKALQSYKEFGTEGELIKSRAPGKEGE